jgi:hypothetical protein
VVTILQVLKKLAATFLKMLQRVSTVIPTYTEKVSDGSEVAVEDVKK